MRFEWDQAKAAASERKHGAAFEDAVLVFGDPFQRSRQDRYEGGEERWQTLGVAGGSVLLLVAHFWRDKGGARRRRRGDHPPNIRPACNKTGKERI